MKTQKLLAAAIAVVMTVASVQNANAQLGKGNTMLGGTASVSMSSNQFTSNFSPMAGYFIANYFAVGANFDLMYQSINNASANRVAASLFGRYYLTKKDNIEPILPLFLQVRGGLVSTSFAGGNTGVAFGAGGIGMNYFLTRNIAVEGIASVNVDNTGFVGIGLNFGFQFFIHESVLFPKKEENKQ